MATSEKHCTDNYSLPRGPQGERGVVGSIGPVGAIGPTGGAGAIGPAGENKIDINIQANRKPYTEVTGSRKNSTWQQLAYFIFPGTTVFTPDYLKVAYSMVSQFRQGSSAFRLVYLDSSGAVVVLAEFEVVKPAGTNTHFYEVSTSALTNLPSAETVLFLEAQLHDDVGTDNIISTRAYALELR